MKLRFELGISSVDAVDIYPHTSFKNREKMIRNDFRSSDGTLFSYKWGDYRQFDFKSEYVPSSSAMLINSWWNSQSELLFFINSGSGEPDQNIDFSEVFSDYSFHNMTRGVNSEDYVKIVEDATSDYHYIADHFNGLERNSLIYFYVKLKQDGKNMAAITISNGASWPYMYIYLDNGSYTDPGSNVFYTSITSEADDFWGATIGVQYDTTSVQTIVMLINSDSSQAYDGDGTSGIWAGYAVLTGEVVASEVHSVMLRNKYCPFDRFQKPYVDKYKGRVVLETY